VTIASIGEIQFDQVLELLRIGVMVQAVSVGRNVDLLEIHPKGLEEPR